MNIFDTWNQIKKVLNDSKKPYLFFKEREIWFIKMGKNIGFEQDGKGDDFLRPVLVLKKFNKQVFWGIPCTSQKKEGPYYFSITDFKKRHNNLILSQLRLFDAQRLGYKIGNINKTEFADLKENLIDLINEIP